MTLIVGLTGGVASGKSTVEQCFRDLGVPVIDADQVAREVVAPGEPALQAIFDRFGEQLRLPDGSLDRRALRGIVFADKAALRQLEGITHPAIRQRLQDWIAARKEPYAVLSAAILVESSLGSLCDRLLVVDVPEALQRQRLKARDGIDDQLARQMLAAQASRAQRRAAADDLLGNDGDLETLRERVAELDRRYRQMTTAGRDGR